MIKKIMQRFKEIDWKAGNGGVLLGVTAMMLAFFAAVLIMDMNNLFYSYTRTQVVTDIIADGSAVAGNKPNGFDENVMENVAEELMNRNDVSNADLDYSISTKEEKDALGNSTGNILVTTKVQAEQDFYLPNYLSYGERFKTTTTAVVRVEPAATRNGMLAISFLTNRGLRPPFVTSTEGHRNGMYVTWFMHNYLDPEYNNLYQMTPDGRIYSHYLVYDYLMCLEINPATYPINTAYGFYWLFSDATRASAKGWTQISSRSAILSSANEGRPTIIARRVTGGTDIDFYIVMPTAGILEGDEIPVAYAGKSGENTNYKRISYAELCDGYDVVVVTHF